MDLAQNRSQTCLNNMNPVDLVDPRLKISAKTAGQNTPSAGGQRV